jgi:hypothetical protein
MKSNSKKSLKKSTGLTKPKSRVPRTILKRSVDSYITIKSSRLILNEVCLYLTLEFIFFNENFKENLKNILDKGINLERIKIIKKKEKVKSYEECFEYGLKQIERVSVNNYSISS